MTATVAQPHDNPPEPVARLFLEAGITEETHRRCGEIDRRAQRILEIYRAELALRGLPPDPDVTGRAELTALAQTPPF